MSRWPPKFSRISHRDLLGGHWDIPFFKYICRMKLLIFALALSGYFALHSILVANSVKRFLQKNILPEKWYRLFFNLLSTLLLFPLAFLFFDLGKNDLFNFFGMEWMGAGLIVYGMIWLYRAMSGYDLGSFLGFAQMSGKNENEHGHLNTTGLNAKVRHPLYFGTLLLILGGFLLMPTDAALAILCISTAYIIIGSRLEERKLEQLFGEKYRSYQRDVPMLIPRFKFK